MNLDRSGLEELTREDCVLLLSRTHLGRIGFHAEALPVILPVAFVADDHGIVIRLHAGSQLDRATRDAVVAFEADQIDPRSGRGWSVSVTGVVSDILDPSELERVRGLGLGGWGCEATDRFALISLDLVSGRRGTPVFVVRRPEEGDWAPAGPDGRAAGPRRARPPQRAVPPQGAQAVGSWTSAFNDTKGTRGRITA